MTEGKIDMATSFFGNFSFDACSYSFASQVKLVATKVKAEVLKGAGHWVLEERRKETTDALLAFL
jgi:hypothetical protein